ncbi:hypothetical protein Fmac_032455 [Flemingia macrophylla]|uniref:Uncharacterized protein n=1 Tax=Flemingia macrophylla TaxID=520843 RepID=A0ABD1L4Y6_9FABA
MVGVVDEEAQIAVWLVVNFVDDGVNVVKVGIEDSTFVELSDFEKEGSDLVGPEECSAEKVVLDDLVGGLCKLNQRESTLLFPAQVNATLFLYYLVDHDSDAICTLKFDSSLPRTPSPRRCSRISTLTCSTTSS